MKIFYFFSVLLSFILLSCDKSYEVPFGDFGYQMDDFGEDELLHQYILDYLSHYERVQDISLLEKVINSQSVLLDETSGVHQIFGYSNYEELVHDIENQRKKAKELNRRYGLQSQPDSIIVDGVLDAFASMNLYQNMFSPYSLEKSCEKIRKNCIISVSAQAVAAHFACGILDATLLGGIFCHGAAIVYQWTAGNNCNYQATRCKDE